VVSGRNKADRWDLVTVVLVLGMSVSGFLSFLFDVFFNTHVFQFARLEDFTAFEALDKFGIFVAANNLHARMLARLSWFLRLRGRL
jgi:hypothetical protein